MNRALRDAWTAALRSGFYAQDHYRLQTNNGFCCLGVLCDIAEQLDSQRYAIKRDNDDGHITGGNLINQPDMLNELTLADEAELLAMNDGRRDTGVDRQPFSVIADWIEAHVPVTE